MAFSLSYSGQVWYWTLPKEVYLVSFIEKEIWHSGTVSVYPVIFFLLNSNKGVISASEFWGDMGYAFHWGEGDKWTTATNSISRSEPPGFYHLKKRINS